MISVVVPCYNEELNIHDLVLRFVSVNQKLKDIGFELVLVNNGSVDKTSDVIDKEIETFQFVKKVSVENNKGYGYGILKGLQACSGEWIGWIHADLQLPPEAFIDFYEYLNEKAFNDRILLKGLRKNRPVSDCLFTFGMSVFESVWLGKFLWDINAQPTLVHKSFFMTWKNPPHDFSFDLYVLYTAMKQKLNVVRIPVIQKKRVKGNSSWNDGKLSARLNLIYRTLIYSKELKKNIKN